MLYLPLSKFPDSSETVVAPGAAITAEGQALVRAAASPASGVTVSQGGATEIFAGFAVAGVSAAPLALLYANKQETILAPAGGILVLALTPVAGQVALFDVTANAAVAFGGGVALVANTVTGLTAGHSIVVTYKYAPTVVQARAIQGDVQPGGYAGSYVGQVGLVKRGVLYTSEFDASVNWAAATAIKTAANGQITDQNGAGTVIPGYVVAAPSGDVPFLGIEFSAA